MKLVFPAPPLPSIAVHGTDARFPARRIYCVGRNFAEHAREMGASVERGTPVFFSKPSDAIVPGGGAIPYPPATTELHHEVELVVALGRDSEGVIASADALELVFGYSVGLDLTRRDLQAAAKAKGLPWDIAKGFDHSAPIGEIVPVAVGGHPRHQAIRLAVNGEVRQQASLSEMVWSVEEVLHHLSLLFRLRAGDLIFMGTPSGVGPLQPGDDFEATIEGLARMSGHITASGR